MAESEPVGTVISYPTTVLVYVNAGEEVPDGSRIVERLNFLIGEGREMQFSQGLPVPESVDGWEIVKAD